MRPIKELMQIMLDNVGEINRDDAPYFEILAYKIYLRDEIGFSEYFKLREALVILRTHEDKIPPGLVEPRRELLIKIINELP